MRDPAGLISDGDGSGSIRFTYEYVTLATSILGVVKQF